MSMLVGTARRSRRTLAARLVALLCLVSGGALANVVEIWQAERTTAQGTQTVALPDTLTLPEGQPAPLRATYRMAVHLDPPPPQLAICMPGLAAHARVRFNGHVVDDRLDRPLAPLPGKLRRIRLIEVPAEFAHAGANWLEIEAAGPRRISVSMVNVGPRAALDRRYEKRLLGVVIGPVVVAMVVGSMALCLMLLWIRRADPLYAYFGLGAFGWAANTAWSVLPVPFIVGLHRDVWWTSLYGFFVAMLVIFCVRFAGWRWPRFERTLGLAAVAGPLLLYAANGAGILGPATQAWLMVWIVAVAVGVVAVARYAWLNRTVNAALLVLTAAVSLGFGVRDWIVNHEGRDNNPVYLVPYAGLLFLVLVAWMLIDRFVAASRELEAMNRELERRVIANGARLTDALEQMRASKDSAEAANRSKSTFLAAASHDLRQPIHALGLYLAALGDDSADAGRQELLQRMKASLSALETMFDALLDVSRMDAGAVVPRLRPFALEPMLHRLADEFAPHAAAKGLRLSVRMAPAPRHLHALSDAMLVERIVRNLLANAVKYTAAGGVLLSCRLRGGARGHWRVEVWDTGPGIGEGDRERVFDEFYQVGNPERDRAGGLGLGLSIVRRLSELLGHRVEMTTVVGRGSRFAVELPCTALALAGFVAAPPQESLDGLGVLVVDDDPEVRDGMQLLLRRWGCRVWAGADADDVLQRARGTSPAAQHAIVADYRLGGGRSGLDAVRALRAAFGRMLPALIVSGDSSPESIARMQASGFDCLSKPVAPERLRRWLATAVRGDAAEAAGPLRAGLLAPGGPP